MTKILLSVTETAEVLSLSERTIWEMSKKHEIPHVHYGRRVLFPADALREWAVKQTEGGNNDD